LRLDSIGFLRLNSARAWSGSVKMRFHKHAILMHSDHEVQIPAALLTTPGKEALNIVEPAEESSFIESIAAWLKSRVPVASQVVQIYEMDSSGDVGAAALEAFAKSRRGSNPTGDLAKRFSAVTAAPVGMPWMWTLAFGQHEDRTPTHGYEPTRETAMAAFAKSWRRES
jgi:hypothetical protein